MDICGYINLADAVNNRQDVMKIFVYACRDVSAISDSTASAEYAIDKLTLNFVSSDNDFSIASYLMLKEIASTALKLDKAVEYPAVAKFRIDLNGNPYLTLSNTYKEIFPVPHKSDVYMPGKVYFNVTKQIAGSDCVSVLKSSLLCCCLNYLALRDGVMDDFAFSASCGRVFLNTACFASGLLGRHWLKSTFPEAYAAVNGRLGCFPRRLRVRRYSNNVDNITAYDEYINPFLKSGIEAILTLSATSYSVYDIFDNTEYLDWLIENQLKSLSEHFPNLLWQGLAKNFDGFNHVTYDDFLSLSLPYGRDAFGYHMINNRKFFNYHKDKHVIALYSNGNLIQR